MKGFDLVKALEEQKAEGRIAELEKALIEERMWVLAISPNEIEWRDQNNLPDDIRSEEDWIPYRKAACEQLQKEGLLGSERA